MIFEVVKFEFVPNIPGCGFKVDRGVICLAAMFIGLPLLIQIITHLLIIVCVFKMNNRKYTGRVIKAMRTIALTLFLYDQCVVIFIVHLIWRLISSKAPPPWLQFISYHCLYTNSAMGFFIYFLTIPKFKENFKMILSKSARVTTTWTRERILWWPHTCEATGLNVGLSEQKIILWRHLFDDLKTIMNFCCWLTCG